MSRNVTGPSAVIVRGSKQVACGQLLTSALSLSESAVRVGGNSREVLGDNLQTLEVPNTVLNPRLTGGYVVNVGRNDARALLIQCQAAGALISGFSHRHEATVNPFGGISANGGVP